MELSYNILSTILEKSPKEAWAKILQFAWETCSKELDSNVVAEVSRRDRSVGLIDHFLATAGWDLWTEFKTSVEKTSDCLQKWWKFQQGGKAVLVLDALSLREAPWIVLGARERGFEIHSMRPTASELPADTTPFAKALGFGQRSSLANDGASNRHFLQGAKTESVDVAWEDCAGMIGSEPAWVFWHHWPDHRLHDHDDPGKGLISLTQEVQENLGSDGFWGFVERLCNGRKLIITSDHGYAASGLFSDSNKGQTDYLKSKYKSGRCIKSEHGPGDFVPPIDVELETEHGKHLFVSGRRKWKSSGGYPTLTHGGLSVLEVVVPFIELSKKVD